MRYDSVELSVGDKLLRGCVTMPDGQGPFPTVCFYHGFCVDRIGMMRLHELFARRCAEEGYACVRFDFYGCGQSEGDFSEMRLSDEVVQAAAIYRWAKAQPFADPEKMFLCGHSMGGSIAGMLAPIVQPMGAILWAPGSFVFYDVSSRVHAVPGHYEAQYDIGGLMMSSEFLTDAMNINAVESAKGYDEGVLIIHGDKDEKVPVYVEAEYMAMYGDKAKLHVVWGANHQFSSWAWKQEVYDASIAYIKAKLG